MNTSHKSLQACLREPIPSIEAAAIMLDRAVTAHLHGHHDVCIDFLVQSNMPEVREWTESLWGKGSKYAPTGPCAAIDSTTAKVPVRMPGAGIQRKLHDRDGYYCRFCGIPVIRKQVRQRFQKLYPDVPIWGRRNLDQHAALQCLWAQYDHLLPHALGGTNELGNLVVTCAPCNFARMQYTLEEAGLLNPLERSPRQGSWNGLERLLSRKPHNALIESDFFKT